MNHTQEDVRWMEQALALSRSGLGQVWPNPAVGCVLVKEGRVVGQACTGPGGRPHAEQLAVLQAGAGARGCTAYVSLEPCNHWGVTSPCTLVLYEAQVARVVIATRDPDPRVDGTGIDRLRRYGMEVVLGVLSEQAQELHAGFMTRVRLGRPLVTIAPRSAAGALCAWAHDAGQDAVLVSLDGHLAEAAHPHALPRIHVSTRVLGHEPRPLPPCEPVTSTAFPRWLIHAGGPGIGVLGFHDEVFEVAADGCRIDPHALLEALGGRGLTRVAVAAADPLAERLRGAGLVDRQAPEPEDAGPGPGT